MKEYSEQKKYYPTLVSDENGTKKPGEGYKRLQKLHALPQKTQDILLSNKIVDFIYGAEQRYHLKDTQTEEFSRTVRGYFFREITEGGFAQKISVLCKISPDEALKLLRAINAIQPHNVNKDVQKREKMSLDKALKKYPQILQQVVTGKPIITKPFLKPLKPTIKNWIMVYEKILDVSAHSMIERGNFVFRSEATKGLSEDERRALLTIFKSRDEGFEIIIDSKERKIIFTKENVQEKEQKRQYVQNKTVNQKPVIKNNQQPQKKNKHTIEYIARTQNKNESTDNLVESQDIDTATQLNDKSASTYSKNPQLHKNIHTTQQDSNITSDIVIPKQVIKPLITSGVKNNSKKQNTDINKKLPQKKKQNTDEINKQKTEAVIGTVNEIGEFHHKMQDRSQIYQKTTKNSSKKDTKENVLHTDVQKEINKNRVEMGRGDTKSIDGTKEWEKEDKKIGTQTYDKKQKVAEGNIIFDDKQEVGRAQKEIGVPLKKENISTIKKKKEKQIITQKKKKTPISGKISFSSNHVMPAEKTKTIQQKKYNTFNMKPMGQTHDVGE